MSERIGYIALGGNIGDRERTLRQAVMLLDATGDVQVLKLSSFIETAPVGGPPGQGMFLNAAIEIRTGLEPLDLLAATRGVESALGRDRSKEIPSGPRTCDLDILLLGDVVLDTPSLKIPHPLMHKRLFVLEPLAEIAPDVIHPVLHETIAELLAELRRHR